MPDTHHAYEHLQGIYFPIAIAVFGVVCLGVAALLIGSHLSFYFKQPYYEGGDFAANALQINALDLSG